MVVYPWSILIVAWVQLIDFGSTFPTPVEIPSPSNAKGFSATPTEVTSGSVDTERDRRNIYVEIGDTDDSSTLFKPSTHLYLNGPGGANNFLRIPSQNQYGQTPYSSSSSSYGQNQYGRYPDYTNGFGFPNAPFDTGFFNDVFPHNEKDWSEDEFRQRSKPRKKDDPLKNLLTKAFADATFDALLEPRPEDDPITKVLADATLDTILQPKPEDDAVSRLIGSSIVDAGVDTFLEPKPGEDLVSKVVGSALADASIDVLTEPEPGEDVIVADTILNGELPRPKAAGRGFGRVRVGTKSNKESTTEDPLQGRSFGIITESTTEDPLHGRSFGIIPDPEISTSTEQLNQTELILRLSKNSKKLHEYESPTEASTILNGDGLPVPKPNAAGRGFGRVKVKTTETPDDETTEEPNLEEEEATTEEDSFGVIPEIPEISEIPEIEIFEIPEISMEDLKQEESTTEESQPETTEESADEISETTTEIPEETTTEIVEQDGHGSQEVIINKHKHHFKSKHEEKHKEDNLSTNDKSSEEISKHKISNNKDKDEKQLKSSESQTNIPSDFRKVTIVLPKISKDQTDKSESDDKKAGSEEDPNVEPVSESSKEKDTKELTTTDEVQHNKKDNNDSNESKESSSKKEKPKSGWKSKFVTSKSKPATSHVSIGNITTTTTTTARITMNIPIPRKPLKPLKIGSEEYREGSSDQDYVSTGYVIKSNSDEDDDFDNDEDDGDDDSHSPFNKLAGNSKDIRQSSEESNSEESDENWLSSKSLESESEESKEQKDSDEDDQDSDSSKEKDK